MSTAEADVERILATKYRCYLFEDNHIRAVEVIEASDDGTAQIEAGRVLEASSGTSAELWDRDRRVSTISRDQSRPL